MAALSFSAIREDVFLGIDARSAENLIPPGYLRDALNTDITQGVAKKRPGYAGYAGNMPVRVVSAEYNNGNDTVCFTLDSAVELASVDLLSSRSTPLVVSGRLSENIGTTGPFSTTDSSKYYPGWFQQTRKTFVAGTGQITIPGTEHGLGTPYIFVNVAESLSSSNLGNRIVSWDNINIDESTYDITIDYTNGTGSDIEIFVYYASVAPVTGSSYASGNTNIGAGSTATLTGGAISAATHQLSNFNIIARCFRDNGTDWDIVTADLVSIDTGTGAVTVTLTNGTGSAADYFVILSAAPAVNFKQGSLSGSTYTVTISNADKAFIFPGVYVSNGTLLEQVIPDEIEYNATTGDIQVTFQNPGLDAFTVYWQYATIRSTQVCVSDDTMDASGVDTNPQLTIWGLDHSEIYGQDPTARAGWSNYIDSYRIAGESRVLGGLGGNLYSVREFGESGIGYLYGAALPRLFGRIASTQKLAPTFWETGSAPGRTRGYITGVGLGDNWATCSAVSYDSVVSGGSVRYDLTIPSLALLTSSGGVEADINNIFTIGDQITCTDMSYSRHNGVFDIVQVTTTGTDTVSIWVTNSSVFTTDWDDAGVLGSVGVFTDRIVLQSDSQFIAGDALISDALTESQLLGVVYTDDVSPTEIVADGISDITTLQAGVQLVGSRTGSVLPLRDSSDVPTAENFLRGDIVFYSGQPNRPLRVSYVNPLDSITGCSIVGDGSVATVTLGSGTTEHLSAGMNVLIRRAGVYTGEITILDVPDLTSFTFETASSDSVSTAVLVGHTLHVGEPISWQDSTGDANTISVERRLIPIEAPDDAYTQTPSTHQRYFDVNSFVNQPLIRSVMASDNTYLTNYNDEVMKFDGTSLYRAGLPSWQPGVFIQTDTAATPIDVGLRSVAYTSFSGSRLIVATEEALGEIPIGSSVRLTDSTETYTITSVKATTAPVYSIYLDRAIDSSAAASGTMSEIASYKYYYRLNAVDQNQNVVASAVSQSEDYTVVLTQNAGIRHKLIGFPAWDNYDFDRIYVQIYRTLKNQSAPFYRVHQQRVTFNAADGYIEFLDTLRDSVLRDLDPVNTALKGLELGIGWQEPYRAKHVTSAANTAILGNIQSYPEMDIQMNGSEISASTIAGTTFRFIRDLLDVGTTTDNLNRINYEFVNAASLTVSSITGTVGSHFDVTCSGSHGLLDGDWVYLYWSTASSPSAANRPLMHSGWWQVADSTVSATTFRVNYSGAVAGAAAAFPDKIALASDSRDVPVLMGVDGNSSATSNTSPLQLFQAARRLALAINATMRLVDTTISGQSAFTPWLMATGGNDTGVSGRLIVRQPRSDVDTFGVVYVAGSTDIDVFLNSVEYSAGSTVSSEITYLPSRILVGYENFAEIFDNPTAVQDSDSDSAIDVNPSDGQEITGIIPFFGESAFGAAQQSGVIVVFKQNSIYLVDVNEKRAGRPSVQRIESEGIGCTAPGSIASTKQGIMFANESGMYVLRRNNQVEYVGLPMERQWLNRVNRDQLDLVQGHHYTIGRKYKLSLPVSDDTSNTEVFMYDHTNESEGRSGTWTRYNNHPATGWCNLEKDAYFASTSGRIFVVRRAGDETDFQDDHSAYTFTLQLRANDFGSASTRKVITSFMINYRTAVPSETSIGTALDTAQQYSSVTGAKIITPGTTLSGIDDENPKDVLYVQHNPQYRRGVSMSIQISNSSLLQGVEVAGVEFRVAPIGSGGLLQASQTGGTGAVNE